MPDCEVVIYNGVKFRRYPNAKQRSDSVYFTPGIGDKKRGVRRLHEEIWKAHHGPIPKGHHIHHKDGNPLNNDISNLECLSPKAHGEAHAGEASEAQLAHLERIRPMTVAWHRSTEGREWHRKHGSDVWHGVVAQKKPKPCEQCGVKFQPRALQEHRFCSNSCKSAWRRDAGLDDLDRLCANCGATFRVNKYAKKKTCSQRCAVELRWGART